MMAKPKKPASELTLRDRFAIGALASPFMGDAAMRAEFAYEIADAMMSERTASLERARAARMAARAGAGALATERGTKAGRDFAEHWMATEMDDISDLRAFLVDNDDGDLTGNAIDAAGETGEYGPSGEPENEENGGVTPGTDEYIDAFVTAAKATFAAAVEAGTKDGAS